MSETRRQLVASHTCPRGGEPSTKVRALNWEPNPRPFGLRAYALTTEPGPDIFVYYMAVGIHDSNKTFRGYIGG